MLIKGQVIVIYRVFASCLIIQLHKCCRKLSAWSILLVPKLLEEPLSTCSSCQNPRIHPKSTMGISDLLESSHQPLASGSTDFPNFIDEVSYPLKLCHAV